jgi:MYXO-CTERM domain-containing protein
MADQERAVEVRRGAAVSANHAAAPAATQRNADAIVAEIERTRENLAQTIDTLADMVSPAKAARRLRERALEQASRPEVQLAAAAVGLAVLGVLILRARRRKK